MHAGGDNQPPHYRRGGWLSPPLPEMMHAEDGYSPTRPSPLRAMQMERRGVADLYSPTRRPALYAADAYSPTRPRALHAAEDYSYSFTRPRSTAPHHEELARSL